MFNKCLFYTIYDFLYLLLYDFSFIKESICVKCSFQMEQQRCYLLHNWIQISSSDILSQNIVLLPAQLRYMNWGTSKSIFLATNQGEKHFFYRTGCFCPGTKTILRDKNTSSSHCVHFTMNLRMLLSNWYENLQFITWLSAQVMNLKKSCHELLIITMKTLI